MFSFLGRKKFSPERASRQSNVLDVLARAGVQVVWIDNNSGAKGVCDRLGYVDFRTGADPASPFYGELGYYDEALVGELERRIAAATGDLLIVLHTMGSHGPAYFRRYPPAFEAFTPACKESSPQRSPQAQVVNAYDNTILYTDYVLDRMIAVLEARPETERTFLFYASDHGESLGENGVYLHGLPELIAPEAQTRIPMFAWLSPRLLADRGLDEERLRAGAGAPRSHDNIPHTMLGLFEVGTSLYQEELDLTRQN
jgi:lipid A ethanolaminephosphotransferase